MLAVATTFDQAMQALSELYTEQHSYRTVVVDSLDWLERLIWAEVCRKRNVESSEDIGYAKAKSIALNHAGVKAADATVTKSMLDYEDGRQVYEIEFYVSGSSGYTRSSGGSYGGYSSGGGHK